MDGRLSIIILEGGPSHGSIPANRPVSFTYGNCWQMTDFMARLGFPWAFDPLQEAPPLQPEFPRLREILERELPPVSKETPPAGQALPEQLPTALSYDYIQHLLEEDGVGEFGFLEKTPPEIVEAVQLHRRMVGRPETNPLCQRLAVLAAFCAFLAAGEHCLGIFGLCHLRAAVRKF